MAQNNPITSRETLKQYCLRSLGKPVIEINVEDDQVEDRIDEALQYFAQYHYDGTERMYLKYQITADDKTRAVANETLSTVTDSADSTVTALNLFDVRYQLRLNDLYDFSSTSIVHYDMTLRHLDMLDHILTGERPIRYNQHKNRLYIDMDWTNDISAGEYLIIEAYRQLDPDTYTSIWNDLYFKRYATALIKKQWGNNLLKFRGMQMLGGVEINGETILAEAKEELEKLQEEIKLAYDVPPMVQIG